MNSITSTAVVIPPMPMTGIFTACAASYTMRSAPKLHTALCSVRTRDVQLVGRNAFAFVQNFQGTLVVRPGVTEDVCKDNDIFLLPQRGEFLVEKRARADVLQSDGIQHSGG